jgi:hypothetical protein
MRRVRPIRGRLVHVTRPREDIVQVRHLVHWPEPRRTGANCTIATEIEIDQEHTLKHAALLIFANLLRRILTK